MASITPSRYSTPNCPSGADLSAPSAVFSGQSHTDATTISEIVFRSLHSSIDQHASNNGAASAVGTLQKEQSAASLSDKPADHSSRTKASSKAETLPADSTHTSSVSNKAVFYYRDMTFSSMDEVEGYFKGKTFSVCERCKRIFRRSRNVGKHFWCYSDEQFEIGLTKLERRLQEESARSTQPTEQKLQFKTSQRAAPGISPEEIENQRVLKACSLGNEAIEWIVKNHQKVARGQQVDESECLDLLDQIPEDLLFRLVSKDYRPLVFVAIYYRFPAIAHSILMRIKDIERPKTFNGPILEDNSLSLAVDMDEIELALEIINQQTSQQILERNGEVIFNSLCTKAELDKKFYRLVYSLGRKIGKFGSNGIVPEEEFEKVLKAAASAHHVLYAKFVADAKEKKRVADATQGLSNVLNWMQTHQNKDVPEGLRILYQVPSDLVNKLRIDNKHLVLVALENNHPHLAYYILKMIETVTDEKVFDGPRAVDVALTLAIRMKAVYVARQIIKQQTKEQLEAIGGKHIYATVFQMAKSQEKFSSLLPLLADKLEIQEADRNQPVVSVGVGTPTRQTGFRATGFSAKSRQGT